MKSWRVTKYNPAHRDAQGKFSSAEWTSVHDVGKFFGGKELTVDEYLRMENAYIDTIVDFCTDAGCLSLTVRDAEQAGPIPNVLGEVLLVPPAPLSKVSCDDLPIVIRSCLREIFWCRLEAEDESFKIHFGYDYYVYILGVEPSSVTLATARARGMFVEPWQSPYLRVE